MLAYEELDRYLVNAESGNPVDADPAQELRALSGAYVRFALDHPGRFRLMFRKDLVNRDDPRYREVSERALIHFAWAAARAEGRDLDTMVKDGDFGAIIAAWSTAHGLASLALEDKFDPILPGGRAAHLSPSSRQRRVRGRSLRGEHDPSRLSPCLDRLPPRGLPDRALAPPPVPAA